MILDIAHGRTPKSGVNGVFKTVNKRNGKEWTYWIANLYLDGKRYIRRCATKEQAIIERQNLIKEYAKFNHIN